MYTVGCELTKLTPFSGRADYAKCLSLAKLMGLQCWEGAWLGEVGEGRGGLSRGKDLKDFHVLLGPGAIGAVL